MSSALRMQILAAVAAEASPTRAAVTRRNALLAAIGTATGLAAFVILASLLSGGEIVRLGGHSPLGHLERSPWLVGATAGGALAIAAAAMWLALGRGGSMIGLPQRWLLTGIIAVPIFLLAWKIGCSVAFHDPMVRFPDRPGLRCLLLSLAVAVGPLWSFVAMRRHDLLHRALNGAALGVAAGAGTWVAVDLWCPVAYLPHLLLGHVLPLVILAGAGALVTAATRR